MVDKSIVIDTIKKMFGSGLSEEVVTSTLKDIGLSDSEARQMIAEATGKAPAAQAAQAQPKQIPVELHEQIAEATAARVKQHIDERSAEDALVHTTTQAVIVNYEARLAEISNRMANIEKKLSSITTLQDFAAKAISLDKKISNVETNLEEVKALTNALKSLLEKVLDTDRSVLAQLEDQKK